MYASSGGHVDVAEYLVEQEPSLLNLHTQVSVLKMLNMRLYWRSQSAGALNKGCPLRGSTVGGCSSY